MDENRTEEMIQETEQAAAQQDAAPAPQPDTPPAAPQKTADSKSMNYTHTFSKPVEILGKQYKTLTFYFEDLTGDDVEAVELELQQRNIIVLDASVSSAFQMGIASRAARMAADELRRLPLRDYMKIKNAARDFLVAVGY